MKNKHKCQNNETQIVIDWFAKNYGADFKGNLLDIGANDAITFSNSYDLIDMGWKAWLIEPSSAFNEIEKLYCNNDKVDYFNVAIGPKRGKMTLYESGAHVKDGMDKALVSTLVPSEMDRWGSVKFNPVTVDVITFNDLLAQMDWTGRIHYLTIDVEGFEMEILKQIDLRAIGCQVLCIEWNGRSVVGSMFTNYCAKYGMKEIHRNGENLIFAK